MVENIDLKKDGIIEASAGTGKTYTIKELVKRIIEEGKALPEEIVVLTFTEKATKELKVRIREAIEEKKDNENLRRAAINFDKFNIFTIHGFCNFIIKNYPFELNVPIDAQVSSIPYKLLLNDLILRELENVLGSTGFEEDFDIQNDLITPVLSLIESFSFEKGHRLKVEGLSEEFKNSQDVLNFIKGSETKPKDEKIIGFIVYYFVLRLLEEAGKYKQKKWIITYDDMIERVYRGLSENQSFRENISKLFKYIIIDEFQDTDLLQWKIFNLLRQGSSLKIYVVGDPKQAIYGFRGGDIHTYFMAKEEINNWEGKLYKLQRNYRSSPSMIKELNNFFNDLDSKTEDGRKSWFENNKDFSFEPQEEPEDEKLKEEERSNNSKALKIFMIESEKAKEAYKKWRDFVISEIAKLLKKNKIKKSDILILCKTSSNARDYEEILNKFGIRAKFFDREGKLFDTKEALNIKILLFALAFPEDLSLKKSLFLSEIFSVDFRNINEFLESEDGRKASELFDKWSYLAREKEWGELFDSVFFESGMFKKLFASNTSVEASSAISKYNQIATYLKDLAYKENSDIYSLAIEFKRMIDEEKHKIWIDEDCDFIRIMTIHSSKGLEAPIVFIGDGFTKRVRYPFYKYYSAKEKSYIYVIRTNKNKNEEEKRLTLLESEAEEERLYYVAFTRAKYLLYFAVADIKSKKSGGKDIFCGWVKEWVEKKGLAENLPTEDPEKITIEPEKTTEVQPSFVGEIDFNRRSFMASFSKIKREKKESEIITEIEISGEDEDFVEESSRLSGVNFGKALHEILEEMDFKTLGNFKSLSDFVSDSNTTKLILSHLNRYFEGITHEEYEKVATMIFNTLKCEIMNGFSLSGLEVSKRMSELDFYYKLDEDLFLTGAIDLVFEHNDKFYIVDWKTNILDGYEGEDFYNNVEDSYGLQYRIYTLAVIEYLKRLNLNPNKKFGGVFYIYLRGVDTNKSGIFYREYPGEISEYREEVLKSYREYLITIL